MMIALGVHTTNPLVKDRVTDFLLSEERVLSDLGDLKTGAHGSAA